VSKEWDDRMNGKRPVVPGEEFDVSHFSEPHLDNAVSCLSAKYHYVNGEEVQDNNDELIWHLPGWGSPKDPSAGLQDDCGDYLKAVGCPGHGNETITGAKHTRKVILKHCHNPACPVCYVPWAVREGNRAADRMRAAELLYRRNGDDLQDVRHFTFSPPQDISKILIKTKAGYKKLKDHAVKLVKKSGIKGGVIIFHSHRINKAKELYISPHFHVIGYGYIEGTKLFYKASAGWIYKNMGKRDSLSGTIIYALDHCGLSYEGEHRIGHAITWFGLLSYNKIVKDSIVIEDKSIPCTACTTALHEYELTIQGDTIKHLLPDWNKDKGIYMIKVKTIVYKLGVRVKTKQATPSDFIRFERG